MKQVNKSTAIVSLFSAGILTAQVPKKIMVEHFTNTKCSICAARNPGLYANLNNQQEALHLSIYPSAPYSGCLLYQQNPTENDARTNYYGVYGSTPRLVVNGTVVSPQADYTANSLFAPYKAQTSPISLRVVQLKFGSDSLRSSIIIKKVAAEQLTSASLFVALAEDTVFYTGSNGEPYHYDVMRKSLSPVNGKTVALPLNIGDSLVYTFSAITTPLWNFKRIYTLAILQETTSKNLIQAEKYTGEGSITGLNAMNTTDEFMLYPNPASNYLLLHNPMMEAYFQIKNSTGLLVFSVRLPAGRHTLELKQLESGIYFVNRLSDGKPGVAKKLMVLR